MFLFLLTVLNFMLFKLIQTVFRGFGKRKEFIEKRLQMFNSGNFIELFFASYMILFLCSSINLVNLTFSNWLESSQSITSIASFIVFASAPIFLVTFIVKNFEKI